MAENLTREGKNHMKRGVSVMVSDPLTGAQIAGTGVLIGSLPPKSLITEVTVVTTTVSTDVSDTMDISYKAGVVVNELVVGAKGAWPASYGDFLQEEETYEDAGGEIIALTGADAIHESWRGRVVIEYIELDKTTGELTNFSDSDDS